MTRMTLGAVAAVLLGLGGTAMAQTAAGQDGAPDCAPPPAQAAAPNVPQAGAVQADATQAEAATQPDPAQDGAAAPNSGSSGWSGGLGGSQLGTNTQGAVAESPTWQPPTARGLDLVGQAEPAPIC